MSRSLHRWSKRRDELNGIKRQGHCACVELFLCNGQPYIQPEILQCFCSKSFITSLGLRQYTTARSYITRTKNACLPLRPNNGEGHSPFHSPLPFSLFHETQPGQPGSPQIN